MKTTARIYVIAIVGTITTVLFTGCNESATGNPQVRLDQDTSASVAGPAWNPSHEQVAVINVNELGDNGQLQNFCVNSTGEILTCWDTETSSTGDPLADGSGIRVFNSQGDRVKTWSLEFGPQAICALPSGDVIVGGNGHLVRIDGAGKIQATGQSPALAAPLITDEEVRALLKEWDIDVESDFQRYKDMLTKRRIDITGLAATDTDVFIACSAPKGFSYAVYRTDHEFNNPVLIVDKLSGCCGQMDIAARDGNLWVAHNGRHRVESFDRQGKKLSSFGRADRRAADAFGGCCEPKNIRFTSDGTVLAGESGPPVALKRFTMDGEFIDVVANPTYDSGCVRATVDVSPDGKRFYLLNVADSAIHVFASTQ